MIWSAAMTNKSIGGLAATAEFVIAGDRDRGDKFDVFRCLHFSTGEPVWTLRYPAPGQLDFGCSPRATPLIHEGLAILYGAFGHLHAVELKTGRVIWKRNLKEEFASAGELTWGLCSSPLIADGQLIVNPGGPQASLVALDPKTGAVQWQTPGGAAGYGSLIVGTFGGVRQIVGHDETTLGGWDAATGRRLWTLTPPRPNDFNVPTPIECDGTLIVSTENNGTRQYRFDNNGVLDPTPLAVNSQLAPDTHSPVRVGRRLFGVWEGLYCLDVDNGLKRIWKADGDEFDNYSSVIASADRVLAMDLHGRFVLFDATAAEFRPLGRWVLPGDEAGLYAHPAVVKDQLFVRGTDAVYRVSLGR